LFFFFWGGEKKKRGFSCKACSQTAQVDAAISPRPRTPASGPEKGGGLEPKQKRGPGKAPSLLHPG